MSFMEWGLNSETFVKGLFGQITGKVAILQSAMNQNLWKEFLSKLNYEAVKLALIFIFETGEIYILELVNWREFFFVDDLWSNFELQILKILEHWELKNFYNWSIVYSNFSV